mgnify:CR=1 FL=1
MMGDIILYILVLFAHGQIQAATFVNVDVCQAVLESVSGDTEVKAIGECTLIRLRAIHADE